MTGQLKYMSEFVWVAAIPVMVISSSLKESILIFDDSMNCQIEI
jgi:hypothetical protein